jgi:hypothetical protein
VLEHDLPDPVSRDEMPVTLLEVEIAPFQFDTILGGLTGPLPGVGPGDSCRNPVNDVAVPKSGDGGSLLEPAPMDGCVDYAPITTRPGRRS